MRPNIVKHIHSPFLHTQTNQLQFQKQIAVMIHNHGRPEITFTELFLLFARFNVKFSSPGEVKKMSKLFNNSFRCVRTVIPFQHLQMTSIKIAPYCTYYIVRVTGKHTQQTFDHNQKSSTLSQQHFLSIQSQNTHNLDKCLQDFILIMTKRYGSEMNWFKVVGSMTVSVSIDSIRFKEHLKHIMRNTCHNECVDRIAGLFIDMQQHFYQSKIKIVTWHRFMSVVKQSIQRLIKTQNHKPENSEMFDDQFNNLRAKSAQKMANKIDQSIQIGHRTVQSNSIFSSKNRKINIQFQEKMCRTQGLQQTFPINFKSTQQYKTECTLHTKMRTTTTFEEFNDGKHQNSGGREGRRGQTMGSLYNRFNRTFQRSKLISRTQTEN